MSQRLMTSLLLVAFCTAALPACTTVNLNEMAGAPSKNQAAERIDQNVVQHAVAKLSTAFSSRGFVEKTSQKRMQSAARILLNGLQAKSETDADNVPAYVLAAPSPETVRADVAYAAHQIDQTTKAAEVYFEMVPVTRDLRKELKSLQKALMATHEAERVFRTALGASAEADLIAYTASMEALRAITDEFGLRVRTQQVEKMAKLRATTLLN